MTHPSSQISLTNKISLAIWLVIALGIWGATIYGAYRFFRLIGGILGQ